MDGHVGKNLTIDGNLACVQPVNELGIGYPVQSAGGVDPDTPQAAKIAFPRSAVPIGKLQRSFHLFLDGPVKTAAGSEVPFCPLKKLLSALEFVVSASYSWHGASLPLGVRQEFPDCLVIRYGHVAALTELAFPLPALFRENMALVGTRALDLSARGQSKPLRCSSMRLHLRHDVLLADAVSVFSLWSQNDVDIPLRENRITFHDSIIGDLA